MGSWTLGPEKFIGREEINRFTRTFSPLPKMALGLSAIGSGGLMHLEQVAI